MRGIKKANRAGWPRSLVLPTNGRNNKGHGETSSVALVSLAIDMTYSLRKEISQNHSDEFVEMFISLALSNVSSQTIVRADSGHSLIRGVKRLHGRFLQLAVYKSALILCRSGIESSADTWSRCSALARSMASPAISCFNQ